MSGSKRPPLDEVLALFQATVAAEGVTTGPGAAAGNSIVDAVLKGYGPNSFLSMLAVVYPGQPSLVDSMDITAFDDVTGEVTFDRAYKGVAAAIPAGVPYKIVPFRFVPAGRVLCVMDFWSDVDDVIDLPAVAADTALPSVVVSGVPSGVTLNRVVAMLKVRAIENTNAGGANAINGAQNIQVRKGAGAWVAAINLADNQWTVAASTRESGDILIGDNDVKATVDGDGTYNFRLPAALVDLASLRLNDLIVGLRFFFSTS